MSARKDVLDLLFLLEVPCIDHAKYVVRVDQLTQHDNLSSCAASWCGMFVNGRSEYGSLNMLDGRSTADGR